MDSSESKTAPFVDAYENMEQRNPVNVGGGSSTSVVDDFKSCQDQENLTSSQASELKSQKGHGSLPFNEAETQFPGLRGIAAFEAASAGDKTEPYVASRDMLASDVLLEMSPELGLVPQSDLAEPIPRNSAAIPSYPNMEQTTPANCTQAESNLVSDGKAGHTEAFWAPEDATFTDIPIPQPILTHQNNTIAPEASSLLPIEAPQAPSTPMIESEPLFPPETACFEPLASPHLQEESVGLAQDVQYEDQTHLAPREPQDLPWGTPLVEPPPPLDAAAIALFNLDDRRREDRRMSRDFDTDSALGDMSYASSMTSVTSSIYESINENGRTYHSYKSGKYVLPNDETEQGRLDSQHYMLCEAIGGRLFRSPLEPHRVNRVLDIATGTGIWAIEFADDFPNAEVIGTDLTPIQPRWCPPNCRFEVDDAEDEWIYPAPFSFIHGRATMTCFTDPKDVIFKCVANLEPGGWLEFQDGMVPFDYEGPNAPPKIVPFSDTEPESVMQRWEKLTIEASIKGGRPWNNVQYYKQWFEEAGLVDVHEYRAKLPLGTWDGLTRKEKRMGLMQFPNMYHGMEGMTLRNIARLGWTFEESKKLVEEVRKEMLSRKYRPSCSYVVMMGRKPEVGETAV